MKLTIKLDEINYGDVAVRAMPLLNFSAVNIGGAVGRMAYAITDLPESLIRDVFDAIPVRVKTTSLKNLQKNIRTESLIHSTTFPTIINWACD